MGTEKGVYQGNVMPHQRHCFQYEGMDAFNTQEEAWMLCTLTSVSAFTHFLP